MIIKRPHTLKYQLKNTDAIQDNDGDWEQGSSSDPIQVPCRYEPNVTEKTISLSAGGESIIYKGIIYLNVNADIIPYGTSIEVFNGDHELFKGSSLNFSNDQLHSRLWV